MKKQPDPHVDSLERALADLVLERQRLRTEGAERPELERNRREIVARQHDWDMADAWVLQEPITRPVFGSADAREGARAFAEKRAPVWTGR